MDCYEASAQDVALSGGTAKTVLQLTTPSTIRARLSMIEISFDGVTAGNTPVLVQLLYQTTAGTGTSLTPTPVDSAAPASLVTAAKDFSAEPSAGTVLRPWRITPYGGLWDYPWPENERPYIAISSRLALKLTAASSQPVNVSATMRYWA